MIIQKKINELKNMEHTLIRKFDEGVLTEKEYNEAIDLIRLRIFEHNEVLKSGTDV